MNPRPYTLRKLKLMADRKREHDYDIAINHACYISQVLSGKFSPGNANPIANERTKILQNQIADKRGKEGFALLGAGLAMIAKSNPYGSVS